MYDRLDELENEQNKNIKKDSKEKFKLESDKTTNTDLRNLGSAKPINPFKVSPKEQSEINKAKDELEKKTYSYQSSVFPKAEKNEEKGKKDPDFHLSDDYKNDL